MTTSLRAVLDTNVLVSALIGQGPPKRLHELWTAGRFRLIASSEILAEYLKVLAYPKLRGNTEEAARLVNETVMDHIQLVQPAPSKLSHPCRDPDDDKFLRVALAAKADMLITGDKDLLVLSGKYSFAILTPSDSINFF